nr:hypothetical protein [Fodinicola feengrottensis]
MLAAGFRVLLPVVRADNDLDWANYRAPTDLAAAARRSGLVEPVGRRLGVDAVAGVGAVVVPAVAGRPRWAAGWAAAAARTTGACRGYRPECRSWP